MSLFFLLALILVAVPIYRWWVWRERLLGIERRLQRLERLEGRIRRLEGRETGIAERPGEGGQPVGLPEAPREPVAEAAYAGPPRETPGALPAGAEQRTQPARAEGAMSEPGYAPKSAPVPPFAALTGRIREWLTGGNTVARVGVVVLFFGVAFLLRYAIERDMLPIELRLAGAALVGFGLLALGWRLRERRRPYALVLQGGGIGVVYLTVFAATNLYALLPAVGAQVLMVALVVLSGALAVLQDARSLALLGAVGGFLAPVIISRGGSHVWLFSYYAVLDAGILGISWFKAWRELNLVGFAFTFVIGAAWGYQYYQPSYFASTQPFLILFFLFYVAIPVLFARRQTPNLRGYVDGSLVFGVPLVASALQSQLVRDFEYGLALSALCTGLFYTLLARWLWRTGEGKMRLLSESFLALGVAFGSLAIPFAVDGRWTAAAWALEGAALVWVGVRQQRLLPRVAGLLLQLGAGAAFLGDLDRAAAPVPVLNSLYLSGLMLSLSGLFSDFYLSRHRDGLRPFEVNASLFAFLWGLLWWFGSGLREIDVHVAAANEMNALLLFVSLSLAAMGWLSRRLGWAHMRYPALGLLWFLAASALALFVDDPAAHPFAGWGAIAWGTAFACQYWLLRAFEEDWVEVAVRVGHVGSLLLAVFVLSWEASWAAGRLVPESETWRHCVWGAFPAACTLLLRAWGPRLAWPVGRFRAEYLGSGLVPLWVFLGLWAAHASFEPGNPSPLGYLPILNPLELVQLLVLGVTLPWAWRESSAVPQRVRRYGWSTVAFLVLNGVIARSVHFLGGVPFAFESLYRSALFQAALAIVWTVLALSLMVVATRRASRATWIVGATLLGVVVGKLFLVDLAQVATVGRIVSFIAVGVLMLVIGYLAPLPPREQRT